jgi:hypothetical protein
MFGKKIRSVVKTAIASMLEQTLGQAKVIK